MKRFSPQLLFFCILFCFRGNSQIILSNNVGDDVKFKNMFSCSQTEWWARDFILSDFGITENQEYLITEGSFAVNYSYSGASYQFNIYEIDENFPSFFDEDKLIGSSTVGRIPYASFTSKIVSVTFETPILIPADVKRILVEVKKTVTPNNPAIALATIAGTDLDTGISWYKGCLNIGNGTGYQSTIDFDGLWRGNPDARFYITVNGEAKTVYPFEITNNNNCINFSDDFSLTNRAEIKSVVWNFDDPTSGVNNTSNSIDVSHQYTIPGVYNVTAEVVHLDNTEYTIAKEVEIFEAPIVNTSVSLKQCDNSDVNGFSSFNLNEVKEKIISTPEDYTITFYEEESLAENNGTSITNITSYQNEQVSLDKVWARIENTNGCYKLSEVNLFVSTTQIPTTLLNSFYKCDEGIDITDGIATFDFSTVTAEIKNIFPVNQQLIINYYRNEEDALSEENEITDITNYQNIGYPNQQNIYIRVDSELDNDCLGLGAHISLNVEKMPVANTVLINPECDNDRDGFYSFDTSNIHNIIIGSQTNVSVSYFDEEGRELSSPLPNPFITSSQKITARVKNTVSQVSNGQCYDETIIDFIVNSVPVANYIDPLEKCDNDTDGFMNFDTSTIETTILGEQTGLLVRYFDENEDELPSPLPNPFYTDSQVIKVRLENPTYNICFEETTIEFIVREKPTFNLIEEDIICITEHPFLELSIENSNSNDNTYTWTNDEDDVISREEVAEIDQGGVYRVYATSIYGCNSEEKEIMIEESYMPVINFNDIKIRDDSENNQIEINTFIEVSI